MGRRAGFISFLFLFILTAQLPFAFGEDPPTLEAWLSFQVPISERDLSQHTSRLDLLPGIVIASPAQRYLYMWTRDAAKMMDWWVFKYGREKDPQLKQLYAKRIWDYVLVSRIQQATPNLSGPGDDRGLGEPKFNINFAPFLDGWGRPQNDGPGSRAIATIKFFNQLQSEGAHEELLSRLYDSRMPTYSLIKVDLEFISRNWMFPSFEIWEEALGHSFYTRLVHRRALVEGAKLARLRGDPGAAQHYEFQASIIASEMEKFWDSSKGYLVDMLGTIQAPYGKGSGLDTSVILGVLEAEGSDGFYGSTNEKVLATAEKLRKAFEPVYRINSVKVNEFGEPMEVAMGRYTEDFYEGGNPWFLITAAFAELHYRAFYQWKKAGVLQITPINFEFFEHVLEGRGIAIRAGEEILSSDLRFEAILKAVSSKGDQFLNRVRYHAGRDGSMAEQFHRDTGYKHGIEPLGWTCRSLLGEDAARKGL